MKTIFILTAVLAVTNCLPLSDFQVNQWNDFKLKHGKAYPTAEEEASRLQIFLQNLKEIEEHNAKYEAGLETYTQGINHFADMTNEEFVATILTPFNLTEAPIPPTVYTTPAGYKAAASVDWRQQGAVTGVKDQGHCGSCWSFSTTGALEGQVFIKKGQLISLSEQNLVDCSQSAGNHGCKGGWPSKTFDFIRQQGGVDTEQSYPYQGVDGQCRFNPSNVGATDNGYSAVPANENSLADALSNIGPISVAVNAKPIQKYRGGIFSGQCDPNDINHAVLAVGYGSEGGQDYWLVKNSWGTGFGENGYFRLARNAGNVCGIASVATYPLV